MKITGNEVAMLRKIDRVGILSYPKAKGRFVIEKLKKKGLVRHSMTGAILTKQGEQILDGINKKGV